MCRTCFIQLHCLHAVCHSLMQKSIVMLASSFICHRIDYCNSFLYGASQYQLDCLQSILNLMARFSYISGSIRSELRWLSVCFWLEFKVCLFVWNCLIGLSSGTLRFCFCKHWPSEPSFGDLVILRENTTLGGVVSPCLGQPFGIPHC